MVAKYVPVAVMLLALLVRLPGLGGFMTADEQNWMLRSGEFWHKLFRQADPGGTFLTTHPGVTAMWLIGAGEAIQEYRLGYDVDEGNLRDFRLAATLPVALATAFLIGMATFLAQKPMGPWFASGIGVFLAVDPYLTGSSQVAHLDALLALFMLNAILAFFNSLNENLQSVTYGLLAGLFTGLALATKFLPALWLFVGIGFVLLLRRPGAWSWNIRYAVRRGFFITGVAGLVCYIAWPALWVKADLGRSFEKDVSGVVTSTHTEYELSEEPIEPKTFYIRTLLGRTTPHVMIITGAVVLVALRASWREKKVHWLVWMWLYAIGYLVLITFVAKKGDRYALPAHTALLVIAGYGAAQALAIMWRRFPRRRVIATAAALAFTTLLVGQVLLWSPYAIAYNNPYFDIRSRTQQGWGEGLDAAAAWLNTHPFRERLYVASWYPSVLQTYFDGPVLSLSSRDDHRVGFVVTYRNMESRAEDDIASNVLDEFIAREPAHVVSIHGVPYVWIYHTLGPYYFRRHVGELLPGMEVGQTVPVSLNNWAGIDIALATFGRQNTGTVTLHIRESVDAASDLRTVSIPAATVPDQDWRRFQFDPISDSAHKTYYVALSSHSSVPGNAVTVRFSGEDVLPGQALVRGRPLKEEEHNRDFLRTGDIGYRFVNE